MNYAIFRSEPIYTLNDLAQIGSHNKREKKAYQSNKDIKIDIGGWKCFVISIIIGFIFN